MVGWCLVSDVAQLLCRCCTGVVRVLPVVGPVVYGGVVSGQRGVSDVVHML